MNTQGSLFSLGVGCMVTNIVYVHSVMETSADRQLGKFTFAHLLGSHRTQIAAIGILAILPFVFLLADIMFFGWTPRWSMRAATMQSSRFL